MRVTPIPEENSLPCTFSKRCKITIFQANHFYQDQQQVQEVLVHKDDFPWLAPGDVIEIYNPENEEGENLGNFVPRLLLMVNAESIYPDNGLQKPIHKETIHVEKSVADIFQLPNYKDVIVTKIDKSGIGLDSVELTFKEQYMGRSEMWRFKKMLIDKCVSLNKKVDLCQGKLRCQVNEMWGKGERVSSGMITADTKIVFRSPTAMIYLFIQMSSEMWDIDIRGDLYFEKAVHGFLAEMFDRWRRQGSSHEVTIVLFSRCFYSVQDKSQFPKHMRDCLQIGYDECYYEDFYRVVVQNERFDDWGPTLRQLNQIFTTYREFILNYHKNVESSADDGLPIPTPVISSAAQGNFMEVLNMSLNTFENHYLNRNLDRTGQQSIVITPGVGIFEVDRELTMITKQRIIDSGVGSDLICVGEQPLHAVPLLKFHHKNCKNSPSEDYSMPHWINLSFYNKGKKFGHSNFTPRVKISTEVDYRVRRSKGQPNLKCLAEAMTSTEDSVLINENAVDMYEEAEKFDDSVSGPVVPSTKEIKRGLSDPEVRIGTNSTPYETTPVIVKSKSMRPEVSLAMLPGNADPVISSSLGSSNNFNYFMHEKRRTSIFEASTVADATAGNDCECKTEETGANMTGFDKSLMGSIDTNFDHQAIKKYLLKPGRALINPFDPSYTTVKLTSNRRRWTHIFPKAGLPGSTDTLHQISHGATLNPDSNSGAGAGAPWESILQTGVDWKSLTIPASLPLTTDFFPDPKSLVADYVVNEYDLTPEDIHSELASELSPLDAKFKWPTTEEVFTEIISQRLSQGFQLILLHRKPDEVADASMPSRLDDSAASSPSASSLSGRSLASKFRGSARRSPGPAGKRPSAVSPALPARPAGEYWLSIGRLFHKVTWSADKTLIRVTKYSPKYPYRPLKIHYRYRFRAPDNDTYELAWVEFQTENLSNYNWNHMDFYICTNGHRDYGLTENMKYWRYRLFALPLAPYQQVTKKIAENRPGERCDLYTCGSLEPDMAKRFLKFVEFSLNRVRRPTPNVMPLTKLPRSEPKRGIGIREYRSNTISFDRSARGVLVGQGRLRNPSGGGHANAPNSGSLLHISPDQQQQGSSPSPTVGSFEKRLNSSLNSCAGEVVANVAVDAGEEAHGLKLTSTLHEIADAMKSAEKGLTFVSKFVPSLPAHTFVSFDAVTWIKESIDGATDEATAIKILNNMHEKRHICHASGSHQQPFVYGFYLFALNPSPRSPLDSPYNSNLESFRNDWTEIEFTLDRDAESGPDGVVPEFLRDNMDEFAVREGRQQEWAKSLFYKTAKIFIDQTGRSDRREWGRLKYQGHYDARSAFDISIHWSVATGAIVSDLVHQWSRKAQQNGISLVPVPSDPFALPITPNSDPIRGPIFIKLDARALMGDKKSNLFEDFAESTWNQRLFLFREAIAHRFGFVNSYIDKSQQSSSAQFSTDHQYIHCTGNMFLLIPTKLSLASGIQGIKLHHSDSKANKETFTRHVSRAKPAYDHSETGFLWSWNFMISRKWKLNSNTGATGDISFMDNLLADFRAFCRNDDNRLADFWAECNDRKRSL